MKKIFKGVLFDLDGTLINTNDLIFETFKYTFKTVLNSDFTKNEFLKYFGEPLKTTFSRFGEESADKLFNTYVDYNDIYHDKLVKEFPGALVGLKSLKEQNFKLGVVTSKRSKSALKGLTFFNYLEYFDVIITAEDTIKHKPDPEPIYKACDKLKISPEEVVMVGDSPFDLQSGKNAGSKTCLVSYSVFDLNELKEYNPDYIINGINELPNILK